MKDELFEFKIEGNPNFSALTISLRDGEAVRAYNSAPIAMSKNVAKKAMSEAGLRHLIESNGSSFEEYYARSGPGSICLAPHFSSDIEHVRLSGETILVQKENLVATSLGVITENKSQTKNEENPEVSLTPVRCFGTGDVFFAAYGSIILLPEVDTSLFVDIQSIVAFTSGLRCQIKPLQGYKSSSFVGDGKVCSFNGTGKIWLQTRKVGHLLTRQH